MNTETNDFEKSAEPAPEEGTNAPLISLTEPPPIPGESYELRIIQSLRRIIRAVEIHSCQLASSHRITGPQLSCLLAIRDQGPLTATRLAQAVYLSPSTVVGIVDRLEEKGLVARTRNAGDRRQIRIGTTAAGETLAATAPSLLQDILKEALAALPQLEQVSIALGLERVVELMEARHISAAPILETGPLVSPENP